MTSRARKRLAALMMALVTFLVASVALAGPATEVVRKKQTTLFGLLKQGDSASINQQVESIFDEMLDYESLAKASLGPAWNDRSEEERKEFTALLKELVQRAYERNLRKTLDFNMLYTGEKPDGSAIWVKTRAESKTDKRVDPIEINFRMVQRDGAWKVSDIETEEVSLVESYRDQFVRVIKKDGWPKLLEKMREKIAKGEG